MSIRKFVNLAGQYIVPFKNPRVVCPPGPVPRCEGKTIIIASMMRSGTHLAIDMLLNNFPALVSKPLYLDADQYFRGEENRIKYMNDEITIGQCIVKTHYPQSIPDNKLEVIKKLAVDAHVILLHRPAKETFKSLNAWGMAEDFVEYQSEVEKFYEFWNVAAPDSLSVQFDELVDEESFRNLIARVESKIGVSPKEKISLPVNPKKVWIMAASKLATRLMGQYSPVINTGIRSGMTGT